MISLNPNFVFHPPDSSHHVVVEIAGSKGSSLKPYSSISHLNFQVFYLSLFIPLKKHIHINFINGFFQCTQNACLLSPGEK